ncbi:MAG TPA: peroxidase [Paucimonas sp.]|nr:peroxidase [Paucimonas sp.]
MTKELDLFDIQGNVIRAYGRYSFPVARYVLLRIHDGGRGRRFVGAVTKRVTTSVDWGDGPGQVKKPRVTVNIAFTYAGLEALELPRASLMGFPAEFAMGMKKRKDILGDDGPSAPEHWDPVWRGEQAHVLVTLNGRTPQDLEDGYAWLNGQVVESEGGVSIMTGHRGDDGAEDLPYQDAKVVCDQDGNPTPKEHFGYTDGISDPVFEGMPSKSSQSVIGRGKQTRNGWAPLATGEFLLGHIDEAHEYPAAPMPMSLSKNGSFMVYRKLHENVGSFNALLDREAKSYPGGRELLAAKFVGRWRDNGAPLTDAPDEKSKAEWDARFAKANAAEQDRMLSGYTFDDDPVGAKCPFSAHVRRINPRASLETNKGAFNTPGALSDRRRILRRGLPYGDVKDPSRDDGNHGIVIMMVNASIERQFEFVQQQWINYGNDFHAGNDKEIILGNHSREHPSKAVLPVEPDSDRCPHFVRNIPRLVETRGGDYFFVPSMTALRIIAAGMVDPT